MHINFKLLSLGTLLSAISFMFNAYAQNLNNIPCPPYWSVQPNPSVENSLSYVHDNGNLAISVTYIGKEAGIDVSSQTFARVASEQMNCTLPVKSNILANGWSFECENNIEALVYGPTGDIVLLAIAGRDAESESDFESFLKFLAYQAKN